MPIYPLLNKLGKTLRSKRATRAGFLLSAIIAALSLSGLVTLIAAAPDRLQGRLAALLLENYQLLVYLLFASVLAAAFIATRSERL
ncbi:hypothetical protein J7M28_13470 [bacterium]|nr:hypothetical protein [bacterium]